MSNSPVSDPPAVQRRENTSGGLPKKGRRAALSSATAYTFATALQRALTFLLLPLFTRVVTPAEYGQLSIAVSISAVASLLFAGGLQAAIFRNHFQFADEPARRLRYIRTLWLTLLIVPPVLAVLITLAAVPVLSSEVLSPINLGLALAAAALNVGGTMVPFAVLRADQRIRAFIIISVVNALTTVVGTVLLVVVLDLGVTAWLTAIVISNAITLVMALLVVPFPRAAGFDISMLADSMRFSLPLVPHFVSQWGLRLADQLVLATMVALSQVGIYSLAASIAAPALMLMSSLGQGFQPTYAAAGKFESRRSELTGVIALQLAVVAMIALAAAVLAPPAVELLAAPRYGAAASLAPWLILGYALLGAYYVPMGVSVLVHGRTRGIAAITVPAAVVNIVGVLLLVPPLGLMGAAIATPLAYAVQLAGITAYARRTKSGIGIPWLRFLTLTCIAGLSFLGAALTAPPPFSVSDLCTRTVWAVAGAFAMVASSAELRDQATLVLRSWRWTQIRLSRSPG